MNGKKYFEDIKRKQILLRKELRIKFVEKCKLYKEQKSFTNSYFIVYFIIEAIGFLYFSKCFFSKKMKFRILYLISIYCKLHS